MDFLVGCQITAPGEALPTLCALKGFFPGVDIPMRRQVAVVCEALPTL